MHRRKDSGLVLFNVLALTAFMSLIVMSMVAVGDLAIARSQKYSEATQAQRIVFAAEASAVSALQADMAADSASETPVDSPDEPWARIAQDTVAISAGTLSVEIADVQGRLNLANFLALDGAQKRPDIRPLEVLLRLAEVDPALGKDLVFWAEEKPLARSLDEVLDKMALPEMEREKISGMLILLPETTVVNANTAPVPVLTAVLNDPAKARLIDATRVREGRLTSKDLGPARLQGMQLGLTSQFFEVRSSATIGETTQSLKSLIYRDSERGIIRVFQRSTRP